VSFTSGGVPATASFRRNITIETEAGSGPHELPVLAYATVDDQYFTTMGIRMVQGRPLGPADMTGATGHVVIDRDLARFLWPGASAPGRRFRMQVEDPWLTVVGVAADVKLGGPSDRFGPYAIYHPTDPGSAGAYVTVIVRSAGDPLTLSEPVRKAVLGVDPDLPVMNMQTATALFDRVLSQPRFLLVLVALFALLALGLAAIGIYGLVAYDVTRRTREIGVRVAIGADRRRIILEVLRSGMMQAGMGICLGIAGSLALSRFMAGFVFGIAPTDPVTMAAAAATLGCVCVLALLIPARRAAGIHPTQALRIE
jgi:putative ABC transport system permease protein